MYAKSVEGSSDAAQYISQIKQAPDWSILYKTNPETEPRAEGASYDLLEDFAKKKDGGLGARLDDTQMAAVEMALRRRVALIQVVIIRCFFSIFQLAERLRRQLQITACSCALRR